MSYKIDDNPPPLHKIETNGVPKDPLVRVLLSMSPGQGLFVPGKTPREIGSRMTTAKKRTGYRFAGRTKEGGCYVWCIAAEAAP